jgi:hypothetical protein
MRRALAIGVCAVLVAPAAWGTDLNLSQLETKDLRLIYQEPAMSFLAPYAAQCAENSLAFQERFFGYKPAEKLTTVLVDFSDMGNASTATTPRDIVIVQLSPISFAYETVMANEHMNWLLNHELVHIAVMDQTAKEDRVFRKLFAGKVAPTDEHPETILYSYLTTPRVAAPAWYQEGIAVFVETWMAAGLGRAQGAYDEMVFRSKVLDDTPFFDPLGLVSEGIATDFQVGANYYLYGTRFMSYLAWRYGPKEVVKWIARTDGSKRYYARQFEAVFGEPIHRAWSEWIDWEHGFQKKNLEAVEQYPTTPYRDLSKQALGSVSREFYDPDTKTIYAAVNYPGTVAYLAAISATDGSVRRILDIKGPTLYTVTSVAWDRDTKTLFYTTDNHDYRDLRQVDPATGKSKTLMKDARIGDLAFDRADRSIWGVRHLNGIATLVHIPYPYEQWKRVRSLPYGEVVYDLDVSPDGKLLSASFGEIDGSQKLRVFRIADLLDDRFEPIHEYEFGSTVPGNFVFSSDGSALFGSSYYTGVSNIFRYDLESEQMDAMSNAVTGFFRPLPQPDGSMIVFRYSGEGFVPAKIDDVHRVEDAAPITFLGQQIAEKYPIVKSWSVGSPADIPIESMTENKGDFVPIHHLGLESIYPVVEGYKNSQAIGFRFNFSDPISINRASFTASYTPDDSLPSDERFHLGFDYQRYDWTVRLKWNDADFYDLFGPTKRSRKGYSASVGFKRPLILDEPRRLDIEAKTAFYGDIDTLPSYQNVGAPATQLYTADLALHYSNVRSSLGHVDDEKGIKWDLMAHEDRIPGDSVPSVLGKLDLGAALPLPHSSVWLRTAAGKAFGHLDDPLANFYFGGFGNNWVDHLEVKRYREFYSFPGLDLNEAPGRTFGKAMLEWNLPPLRFEKAGTPGFYFSWARTSLFATGLITNFDAGAPDEQKIGNVGAQMDFRISVLSRLHMTLSLGYASAFQRGQSPRDEFMVSLKVLGQGSD